MMFIYYDVMGVTTAAHMRLLSTHTILAAGPDYDVDTGAMYIQHLYLSKVTHKGRVVYPHFTTATDTRNIQVVFRVVMDTIVRENLAAIQML